MRMYLATFLLEISQSRVCYICPKVKARPLCLSFLPTCLPPTAQVVSALARQKKSSLPEHASLEDPMMLSPRDGPFMLLFHSEKRQIDLTPRVNIITSVLQSNLEDNNYQGYVCCCCRLKRFPHHCIFAVVHQKYARRTHAEVELRPFLL